jgi:hypothetical protein
LHKLGGFSAPVFELRAHIENGEPFSAFFKNATLHGEMWLDRTGLAFWLLHQQRRLNRRIIKENS